MKYAAITTLIAHVNLLGGGCNDPIVAVFDLCLDNQKLFIGERVAGLYVVVLDLCLDNQKLFSGEGVAGLYEPVLNFRLNRRLLRRY